MTQDELMNQLIINNEFDGLTPQDFADALGKTFLNIKAITDRYSNHEAPSMVIEEDDFKVAPYMFLDGWTPLFNYASDFNEIGEVKVLVLYDGIEFYCDFKIEDDTCYIKLKDKDKEGLITRYGEIAGLDVAILIREVYEEE